MTAYQPEVIVLGAGIVGMMTARELALSGLKVAVVEKSLPGREASRAAAGIISPLYPWRSPAELMALTLYSQRIFPVLVGDIRRDTGLEVDWINSGMVVFDEDELGPAQAWGRYNAQPVEYVEPENLRRLVPALANFPRPAIFLPTVAHLHASRLLRAIQESLFSLGVPIWQLTEISKLKIRDHKLEGLVSANGDDILCKKIVICTGAWSGELAEQSGLSLPVKPMLGQIIQYDAPPGLISRILLEDGFYVVARRNGNIVVGATLEDTGFDKTTSEHGLTELKDRAEQMLPLLSGVAVYRQWAGLRPATPDDLPYIGAHPDVDGLYFNTGHHRHGLTTGPASARLLADLLCERSPVLDPAPYAVHRVL